MAQTSFPVRNVAYTFQIEGFFSQADPTTYQTNPTLAAGDFKIRLDAGNDGALTNTPTVINSERAVQFVLTAAEMTADEVIITCQDAAGAQWIATAIRLFPKIVGSIDSGVCQTAGQTATNAVLRAAVSYTSPIPVGAWLQVLGGTGAGQSRLVNAWDNTGKAATVDALTTTLDNTSEYIFWAGPPASVASPIPVNATQFAGQTITAAAGVTLPTSVASPTNITAATGVDITKILGTAIATPATAGVLDVNAKAINNVATTPVTTIKAVQGLAVDGVVPTVTNLTNAPTAGDLTATMKTSVTTAATAATPIAASVAGAVGSVAGNVGGNVVGSVASVTATVNADIKKINGTTVNGDGSGTPWGP